MSFRLGIEPHVIPYGDRTGHRLFGVRGTFRGYSGLPLTTPSSTRSQGRGSGHIPLLFVRGFRVNLLLTFGLGCRLQFPSSRALVLLDEMG